MSLRIMFVVRDAGLRIGSAVTRARDFADDVCVIQIERDPDTHHLAEMAGATVLRHEGEVNAPDLARLALDHNAEITTLLIDLDEQWKLADLPRNVGLARQGHDVFIAFKHRSQRTRDGESPDPEAPIGPDSYSYAESNIQFACTSPAGLAAIAKQDATSRPADLPRDINLRVVELEAPGPAHHRESLATASRFAQFFYWTLESRHPLLLFGIPGLIFFLLGFEMAQSLIAFEGPHDTVSIGVALAAFAATLVGVFSLTASLILYVLGKQVDKLPGASR